MKITFKNNPNYKPNTINMRKNYSPFVLPRIFKSLFFLLLFSVLPLELMCQNTVTYSSTGNWTAPEGVTSVTVEVWGGGGKGGTRTSNGTSGGGGGGAYSRKVVSVIPNTSYTVTVGLGSNTTSPGGDSWFGNATTILAKGGGSVLNNTQTGGTGGDKNQGIGDVVYSGGNGADGTATYSGGGGSSAGTGADGSNSTSNIAPTPPTGGGIGGNGRTNQGGGNVGQVPGGGGGGGFRTNNGDRLGGVGGNGQVRITFNCPSQTANAGSNQSLPICTTSTSLNANTPSFGVGTWTLISGTGTIVSPNSPTTSITDLATNGVAVFRWTITNGDCGSVSSDVSVTTTVGPNCVTHCAPVGNLNCTLDDYINRVVINTLDNTSLCSTGGFTIYPASGTQTTTLIKGVAYNLQLRFGPGTGNHGAGVWFDFNQNGVFTDPGEFFLISNAIAPNSTTNLSISIPLTAADGLVKMRVRYAYNLTVTSSMSCTMSGTFGETEDYTVNLITPPPCSTPTTQPTLLQIVASGTSVTGTFQAATANSYLVVYNTTGTIPNPVNGTSYTIGQTIGTGNIVADTDSNTSFTINGLNTNTLYHVFVFSYNNLCIGGPLYLSNSPLSSTVTTLNANYCSATIGSGYDASLLYINRVSFEGSLNDVTNTSTFSTNPNGYQDFTGLPNITQQAQGEGLNMYIQTNARVGIKAWVDWNKNGVFSDAGEEVFNTGSSLTASSTFGFIIPTTVAPGNYRIRVRAVYNTNTFSACGLISNYGETEDYIINVIARCDSFITSITNGFTCGDGTATLNVTGSSGTTEYRWYNAETGGTLLATTTSGSWTTPVLSSSTAFYVSTFNGTCESTSRKEVFALVKSLPTLTISPENPVVCGEETIISLAATGDGEEVFLINEDFENGLNTFSNINLLSYTATINNKTAWQPRTSTFIPAEQVWFPAISSGFGPNRFVMATSDVGMQNSTTQYRIHNALVSPVINSSDFTSLFLSFRCYYSRYFTNNSNTTADFLTVEVSTDGGTNYVALNTYYEDIGFGTRFETLTFNLNGYLNQANLRIRIRYYGEWCDGVAVDDFKVYGYKPLLPIFTWTSDTPVNAFTDAACSIPYVSGTQANQVYVKPTLAQMENPTYTFTANVPLANGCTVSQNVNVTNNSKVFQNINTNWDDDNNWKPLGIPTADNCVVIPTQSIISGTNYQALAKNLRVKETGNLNIQSGNSLTVTDIVHVENNGIFQLENNSSLVQINDIQNIGNIIYKRNALVKRLDYVYWSSPVKNFVVNSMSLNPAPGPIYKWNPTLANLNNGYGNWVSASGQIMNVAEGYIVRAPSSYSLTNPTLFTATFTGTPHNGTISKTVFRGPYTGIPYLGNNGVEINNLSDNWNLIGNPYPSSIRASQFIFDNSSVIETNLQFWTHGLSPSNLVSSPFYGSFGYNYSPNDYTVFNYTGMTCCPAIGSDFFIGSGQSFFVQMKDGPAGSGEVLFSNNLRNKAYTNSTFFRHTINSETAFDIETIEKHRIWLDLYNLSGQSDRILIGYVEGATNEKDPFFDAVKTQSNSLQLFSTDSNNKYSIQAKGLPFSSTDIIPLALNVIQAGIHHIGIVEVDGLFANQSVLLKDEFLNVTHDLKSAPYQFQSESGFHPNRFKLIFQNETLNLNDATWSQVIAYKDNLRTIQVKANTLLDEIKIYDMQGRLIKEIKNINTDVLSVQLNEVADQVLILQIKTIENTIFTRKIL